MLTSLSKGLQTGQVAMEYELEKWLQSAWVKNTRFYGLELCQDLFGNWLVRRTWGSRLSRGAGKSLSMLCEDFETAVKAYEKQEHRRLNRGYQ